MGSGGHQLDGDGHPHWHKGKDGPSRDNDANDDRYGGAPSLTRMGALPKAVLERVFPTRPV